MTLTLKLDLDMVEMYLYTTIEVPSFFSSTVVAGIDRYTNTQPHRQTDRPNIEML